MNKNIMSKEETRQPGGPGMLSGKIEIGKSVDTKEKEAQQGFKEYMNFMFQQYISELLICYTTEEQRARLNDEKKMQRFSAWAFNQFMTTRKSMLKIRWDSVIRHQQPEKNQVLAEINRICGEA